MTQATSVNTSGLIYSDLATGSASVGEGLGSGKSQKAFGMPVDTHESNLPVQDQEMLRSEINGSIESDKERTVTTLSGKEKIDALNKEILEIKSNLGVEFERQFPRNEEGASGKELDYDGQFKMITDKCNSKRESFLKSKEFKGFNDLFDAMGGLKDRILSKVSFIIPEPGKSVPSGDLIYFGLGLSVNSEQSDVFSGKSEIPLKTIPLKTIEAVFKGFDSTFDFGAVFKAQTLKPSAVPMPTADKGSAETGGKQSAGLPEGTGSTGIHDSDMSSQAAPPEKQEGKSDSLNRDEDKSAIPERNRLRAALNSLACCTGSECTEYQQVNDGAPTDNVDMEASPGRVFTDAVNANTEESLSETDQLLNKESSEVEKPDDNKLYESEQFEKDKRCFFVLAILSKILDGFPSWLINKDGTKDDSKSGLSPIPEASSGGGVSGASSDDSGLDELSSEVSQLKSLQDEKKRLENMLSILKELSVIDDLIKSIKWFVDFKEPVEKIIKEFGGRE